MPPTHYIHSLTTLWIVLFSINNSIFYCDQCSVVAQSYSPPFISSYHFIEVADHYWVNPFALFFSLDSESGIEPVS